MSRLMALVLALLAGVWIAWFGERLPDPAPPDAPAKTFSAGRAMADVRAIAARPHPIGSPENARVRDHLVARMQALGLETTVRRSSGVNSREMRGELAVAGAAVENLVGVLPGRDRRLPAVAVMAHYDSVPGSPGAADDAAGTAAALEIARALKARGVPARDVVFLITDGEESGLLGAEAFFHRDPLARRLGFVLNMEARGGGGRVQMFETGAGNGRTIDLFRRAVDRPAATALSTFVYQQMPNGTDFTLPKEAGLQGLNFAFIGRQFDYHSVTSTPAHLDQGSLQEMGDQVLAATVAAAYAPSLPAKAPNAAHSQVPGGLFVAYPAWAGWIVIAASALLIGLGAWRARRRGELPWIDACRGAGALLFALLGGVAVLNLARAATGAGAGWFEQRWLLAQAHRWEAAVLLLALGFLLLAAATASRGRRLVAALPALAGVAAFALNRTDMIALGGGLAAGLIGLFAYWRPSTRAGAWTGVLAVGLVLALALQVAAPTIAYVIAWPLLAAAVGAAATDMGARPGLPSLGVLAVLAALVTGFAGAYAHVAYLSLDVMLLQALPMAMAALALWPLAQPAEGAPPARLIGPLLLVAGAVVTLVVRLDPPWSARHPELTYVAYHVDQGGGHAWRISLAPNTPLWTRQALTADGGAIGEIEHWLARQPIKAAVARPVEEAPPQIELFDLPDGRLVLRAVPPHGARSLALRLRPSAPAAIERLAEVDRRLPLKPGRWTRIEWEAAPAGVEIVLKPEAPGALDVRYAATLERWPKGATPLPPRPRDVMAFDSSDSTIVTGSRRFTWKAGAAIGAP
ncbi:M20/M25/M40 family metallo-hydrolase [Phenylobacterium sp.]|uniref:M20/M25/M40 family metallo-hydrolase n=1 Tax=Phenylobacterium sp. TaxID=1871053 RepID=UPI00391A4F3D